MPRARARRERGADGAQRADPHAPPGQGSLPIERAVQRARAACCGGAAPRKWAALLFLFERRPAAELAVDLNTRVVYRPSSGPPGVLGWIGLDYVEELTFGDGRSIGTLLLQPFLLRADGLPGTPPIFDGPYDWQLQWRYVSLDVTRWEHRGVSWLTGHFELPFGLDRQIDTNGTLRQYTNGRNLGLKTDWGTSLHGERAGVDYQVALTRGSGNDYRSKDGNYAFALRVGNSLEENFSYGFSFMDASLSASPKPDRTRFGADFRWRRPGFSLLGEASFGQLGKDNAETQGNIARTSGLLHIPNGLTNMFSSMVLFGPVTRIFGEWKTVLVSGACGSLLAAG